MPSTQIAQQFNRRLGETRLRYVTNLFPKRNMQTELDRILAFNEQLLSLSRAGLPVDIGGATDAESIEATIAKINANLTLAIARGQSPQQAIGDAEAMPPRYRLAILSLLHRDHSTVAFDYLTTQARAQRELVFDVSRWFYQLGVLCLIALLGFTYLIFRVTPKIASVFNDLGLGFDSSIRFSNYARETYWTWLPLLLVIILVGTWVWRRYSARLPWSSLPGGKRYQTAQSNAEVADRLATLVEQDVSVDEAMVLSHTNLAALPPLLKWAAVGDLEGESRSDAFQMVAGSYRNKATSLARIWRVIVPTVMTALVGGVIVFAYALTVFLPWLSFLTALS